MALPLQGEMMGKYVLLKQYRGARASVNDVQMDQWTPEELAAHTQYMQDFAARLEATGGFVDSQALAGARFPRTEEVRQTLTASERPHQNAISIAAAQLRDPK